MVRHREQDKADSAGSKEGLDTSVATQLQGLKGARGDQQWCYKRCCCGPTLSCCNSSAFQTVLSISKLLLHAVRALQCIAGCWDNKAVSEYM